MAEIHNLNTTDANNTDRFPENQAPSTLNNGARALEGIIARFVSDFNGPGVPVATLSGSVIQFTSNRTSITQTGTTSNYIANGLFGFLMGDNPSGDGVSVRINDIQTLTLRDNRGQSLSSSAVPSGSFNIILKDDTNNYFRLIASSNHTLFSPKLVTPIATSTIGVGAATPATSGAGITYPATQNASTDANTLDDYEEGTWTPSDGSGGSLTFSVAKGEYFKIGKYVWVSFQVSFPSTADTHQVTIDGLPFTADATQTSNMQCVAPGATDSGRSDRFVFARSTATFVISDTSNSAVQNSSYSGKFITGFGVYKSTA